MADETLKKQGSDYSEENIITLEWYEHIRRRSGMYIGRLGNGERQGDGIYVLLKEVIDNSIDEFSMGYGKRVDITIDEDRTVTVRDFGRGIPLGKVVDVVSKLNTGGKFDTASFQKSVGMNGVGTKAVNAMSSDFLVESYRDGQSSFAHFSRGILLDSGQRDTTEKNGTLIRFTPDDQMFEGYSFHMDIVETMVKNYSYLKKGLTLVLNGVPYKSENGLLDLVTENMAEKPLYPLIHIEGPDIEIVLTHGSSYGENISSFVNGQNTRDGGTHLAAYREAIAKTLPRPSSAPPTCGRRRSRTRTAAPPRTAARPSAASSTTSCPRTWTTTSTCTWTSSRSSRRRSRSPRPSARKSPVSRKRPASGTRRPTSTTASSATAASTSTTSR